MCMGIFYLAHIINHDAAEAFLFPWFIFIIAAVGDIIQSIKTLKDINK